MFLCCTGRQDSHSLDSSGGNRIQEIHLSQRRVELRDRRVGGDVIRREAVLGDVQPRREFHACVHPVFTNEPLIMFHHDTSRVGDVLPTVALEVPSRTFEKNRPACCAVPLAALPLKL